MSRISRRDMLAMGAAAVMAADAQEKNESKAAGPDQKRLTLAFIGTGHRAWQHLEVLKSVPDFQVVALADPTTENLDHAASIVGTGVHTYADYHDMLGKEKSVDGVVVVTPTFLHADPTIAALSDGHHVLCEKPMAISIEQANAMIAASERNGKTLQIGLQMRCDPVYAKVAEIGRSEQLGGIAYVSGNLYRGDWYDKSWKYVDPKTGVATNWRYLTKTAGSSLMEDGIHELDILNWAINSNVTRVRATGGNNVYKNRETIDHAGVLIDYENGVKLAFEFCIFAPNSGAASRRMALIGPEGNLQMEQRKLTLRQKREGAKQVDVAEHVPAPVAAQKNGGDHDIGTYRQYLAFANSIRTGAKPLSNGQSAKNVLKISLLAEKSLREGRIVSWNDLPA